MNVYMTDNEHGQSIACILNAGGSISVPHKSWGGVEWHTFDGWGYSIREPNTIYEMSIMAEVING